MEVTKERSKKLLNLKLLRIQNGVTQRELAYELGVKPSTVSMIENGTNLPSLELAYKIANYFGKSIEEVFYSDMKIT